MKNVFLVINGDNQQYFIEQANAENHASKNGGDVFCEEMAEKKFNEYKKQKDFFLDLPKMEVKKNGTANKNQQKKQTPEQLQKELERLKIENEKLKKQNTLSYEDAAELYKKKAELLRKISVFENVLKSLSTDINLYPSENEELHTENAALVFYTGSYNRKERFKITNIHVISDFLEFTRDKVNLKIEMLKEEVQEL